MDEATMSEIEFRINDILERAAEVVNKKLKPAKTLIGEVKEAMNKGVDTITTLQLQEWALAIPILCSDIVPNKEAYNLMSDLWNIEFKQLAAKNLLELDKKKTEIDTINKLAGTEGAKKSSISEYVKNVLAGTQEALWMLGNTIRKILEGRIAVGDC